MGMKPMLFTATPMGDKPYYVYELSYPEGFVDTDGVDLSNVVFYVGKGTANFERNAVQRIDEHELSAAGGRDQSNENKYNVILSIWSKNLPIQKSIVFYSDFEEEALQEEAQRIKQHSGPHLTNKRFPAVEPPEVEPHPVFALSNETMKHFPWGWNTSMEEQIQIDPTKLKALQEKLALIQEYPFASKSIKFDEETLVSVLSVIDQALFQSMERVQPIRKEGKQ